MRIVLDTGPLVALLNDRDRHHAWACDQIGRLSSPLWTCEAVVAEAAHLTGRGAEIVGMLGEGALRIDFRLEEQWSAVAALLDRYAARMDLADACVVRMSELHRASQVFTLDRKDFTVYRRNGRDVIPLLAPPA